MNFIKSKFGINSSTPCFIDVILDDYDELLIKSKQMFCEIFYGEENEKIANFQKNNFWDKLNIVGDNEIEYTKTNSKTLYYSEKETLIELGKKYFEKYGLEVSENYFLPANNCVEIHYATSDENETNPIFDWHKDDYGGINCKVHTLIIYLENTSNNGGFEIECKKTKKNYVIKTEKNKCLMFSGDVEHRALALKNGTRIAVVIQIERK